MSICCEVLRSSTPLLCLLSTWGVMSRPWILFCTCTNTHIPYNLKGVVYFSDEHFTACVITNTGTVWFHDAECLQVPPFCTNLKAWQPSILTEQFWPFMHVALLPPLNQRELGFAVRHSTSHPVFLMPVPLNR